MLEKRPPLTAKQRGTGDTMPCPYCGKAMQDIGLDLGGRHHPNFVCTCPAFKEAREKEAKEDVRRELIAMRQRHRAEYIQRLTDKSGVPPKYAGKTFADYHATSPKQQKALKTAEDYVQNFETNLSRGKGLYIAGNFGTGKSMLASIISLELIRQGHEVKYGTAYKLLRNIRKRTVTNGESEEAVLEEYAACKLLVLDDLGKEKSTDYSIATISTIINDRYENALPVIITSNYTLNYLEKALTPPNGDGSTARSVVSRLAEMTDALIFDWADRRTKNG